MDKIDALVSQNVVLARALEKLLEHYVNLAGSGDCGHWDPETEPEVIAARLALDAQREIVGK